MVVMYRIASMMKLKNEPLLALIRTEPLDKHRIPLARIRKRLTADPKRSLRNLPEHAKEKTKK